MAEKKKKWWVIAKEEGRICRICHEPVAKNYWKDKTYDHLCWPCWARESKIDRNLGTPGHLGRD